MEQVNSVYLKEEQNVYEKLNTFIHLKVKSSIGLRNYLLGFKNIVFIANKKLLFVLGTESKEVSMIKYKYFFHLNKIVYSTWKNKDVKIKYCFLNKEKQNICDIDIQDCLDYLSLNIEQFISNRSILELKDEEVFVEQPKSEVIYFNEKTHRQVFSNFIQSSENITAFEVCQSIACANDKELVQSGSIVLIHGETSTGKTHLLSAIQNFYQTAGGKVFYSTASNFLRMYVESVKQQAGFSFQDKILENEIIMIDDIDELIGKNGTLNLLRQIISFAANNKRFIVITSKLAPTLLSEKSLVYKDILSQAMSLKIDQAQNDLKAKIAVNYIAEKNMNIPISIVKDLILKLDCNIRELKNYIKKLSIVQSIRKFDLNLTLALEILQDDINNDMYMKKAISNEKIVEIVSEYYKLNPNELCSKIKTTNVCRARNVAILLMRQINSSNFQEIGRVLNRKHTSIMASLKNVETWLDNDAKLPAELADLKAMIF